VEVLKGVSMRAGKDGVISMLGSSGSGKSTFLRCLNLLEIPNSGSVAVNGKTIAMAVARDGRPVSEDIPVSEDMKQVARIRTTPGTVFQNFNLWSHMTVLENIIEAPVHVLKVPKAKAIDKYSWCAARHHSRELPA
jgi:arginine/ornithine transport system ATP-binding protein